MFKNKMDRILEDPKNIWKDSDSNNKILVNIRK